MTLSALLVLLAPSQCVDECGLVEYVVESTPGIGGERAFSKLGDPLHGAVYAGADGQSVALSGVGINLWVRGSPFINGTMLQIETELETAPFRMEYVDGNLRTTTSGAWWFTDGIIGQGPSSTSLGSLAIRGWPVFLQTPAVSSGELFGVVNGIGAGMPHPLSLSVASNVYTLSLGPGLAMLGATSTATGLIKAGSFNGAVRFGGEAEIGSVANEPPSGFVASVAKNLTTSGKTLLASWHGGGLQSDRMPLSVTCSMGAAYVDITGPYVRVDPSGCACSVNVAATTAAAINAPIRGVTVMVVGSGTATLAGLEYTPEPCATVGLVRGQSAVLAYEPLLGSWTVQSCE